MRVAWLMDQPVKKRPIGRPKGSGDGGDEYHVRLNKHAFRFALLGYAEEEIAKALGIGYAQYKKWKVRYPAFRDWIEKGRARTSTRVAKQLLKNALGFWVEESETRTAGATTTTIVRRKYVAPNTTAQIFWLKNRARKHWYDMVALPALAPIDPDDAGRQIRDAVKTIRALEGLTDDAR